LIGFPRLCSRDLTVGVRITQGPGHLFHTLHELRQARALHEHLVLATIEHTSEQRCLEGQGGQQAFFIAALVTWHTTAEQHMFPDRQVLP
jgi:hypothetical protein